MEITPLRKYPTPRFPTALQAARDPALLEKLAPRFGVKKLSIAAALLAVLTAASGCDAGGGLVRTDGAPPMPVSPTPEIAGGIMPLTPLNEDDVLTILRNEAEAQGITFGEEAIALTAGERTLEADLPSSDGKLAVAALYAGEEPGRLLEGDEAPVLTIGSVAQLNDSEGNSIDTLLLSPVYEGEDENVREAFRQFIDWLKTEGVL